MTQALISVREAPPVFVFQNLFGSQYEGGANWLEVTIRAVNSLARPPQCIVAGAQPETLPPDLHVLTGVRAIPTPSQPASTSANARGVLRRVTRRRWEDRSLSALPAADLWVGFAGFEGLRSDRPLLVWYPDFQFLHLPEYFSEQEVNERLAQWEFVVDRADRIIVISDAVRRDAVAAAPRSQGKLRVAAFPPNISARCLTVSVEEVTRTYSLHDPYFLVCAQFWKHKNHKLVIAAMAELRASGRPVPIVVFTGRTSDYRHPDYFSSLLQMIAKSGLHSKCRVLGLVPREDQIALIRGSQAVIQPSRFEGRGAISEEASLLGVPALCSDIEVHREIGASNFFSPTSTADLAQLLMKSYLTDRPSNCVVLERAEAALRSYGTSFMNIAMEAMHASQARGRRRNMA